MGPFKGIQIQHYLSKTPSRDSRATTTQQHLLAVLVRPAQRLDDETLAAVQAVGQVLLVTGLEMLRVQRRDGRRRCGTNTETFISLQSLYFSLI